MPRGLDLDKVRDAGGAPSIPEAAAVFAAVDAYCKTMGMGGVYVEDMPRHLEELKVSIAKVEAVTVTS
jgi:hypothetical protein